MEQQQDYTEVQINLLSQLLRRLLEKLLKTKSFTVQDVLSEKISLSQNKDKNKELTITDLETIEDTLLISILMNEYGYEEENLQRLADILYEVAFCKSECSKVLFQKALTLYQYCLANGKDTVHFFTFNRVQELKNRLHHFSEW